MGICMEDREGHFVRLKESSRLRDIVHRSAHSGNVDIPDLQNTYSEVEACYIMWQVFNTLQDRTNCKHYSLSSS